MSENSKTYGRRDWVLGAVVLALGVTGALAWHLMTPAKTANVDQVQPFDAVTAMVVCREAIKKTSRDPEKAEVPSVFVHQVDEELRIYWGPQNKMVRLRNGLGSEVGVPATCIANKDKRTITSLTVNGVRLI